MCFSSCGAVCIYIVDCKGVAVDCVNGLDGCVCSDVIKCNIPIIECVTFYLRSIRSGCCCTMCNSLILADLITILVKELNSILVNFILCSYSKITCDVVVCLVPTGKGVTFSCGISRCCCSRAIFNFATLQFCTIIIHKLNSVLINRGAELCSVGCIAGYGSNFRSPACEGVGILCIGGFVGGAIETRSCTVLVFFRCGNAVDYPCDGVFVDGGSELCSVGCIFGNCLNCRRPSIIKGISILCGCGLGRGFACVSRCFTVSNLFFFEGVAVAVYPCDGVFINGGIISCSVGCITGYSNDFRSPACKCVGVLCIGSLGRVFACVSRCCTVSDFTALQFGAVFVYKLDSILVNGFGVGCSVGGFACYSNDFRSPACEGVGVLCICFLGRGFACVSRFFAVSNFTGLQLGAVFIYKCDGVFVDGEIELCSVGCIFGNCLNCRRPSIIKGISILCGCGLGRGFACVSRCFTVSNLFFFEGVAVAVYPCDGVFINGGIISCSVGCITGYSNDFRSPACKGVGILCIGCLIGRALETRCYTVFILFCCCVAVYDPGDGVLICCPLGVNKDIFCEDITLCNLCFVGGVPTSKGITRSCGGGQWAVGFVVILCDGIYIGNTVCNICTVLINADVVKNYGVVAAVGIQADLRFHNGRIVRSSKYVVPIFIAGKSVGLAIGKVNPCAVFIAEEDVNIPAVAGNVNVNLIRLAGFNCEIRRSNGCFVGTVVGGDHKTFIISLFNSTFARCRIPRVYVNQIIKRNGVAVDRPLGGKGCVTCHAADNVTAVADTVLHPVTVGSCYLPASEGVAGSGGCGQSECLGYRVGKCCSIGHGTAVKNISKCRSSFPPICINSLVGCHGSGVGKCTAGQVFVFIPAIQNIAESFCLCKFNIFAVGNISLRGHNESADKIVVIFSGIQTDVGEGLREGILAG